MTYKNAFIRLGPDNTVTFMHIDPLNPITGLSKSKEELESIGVFAKVPEVDIIQTSVKGMAAVPYYNSETGEVYYQYKPVPMTVEERLTLLEDAFTDLIMNGGV